MRTTGKQSAMWGITTYFNPARYASRLANYRAFRAASAAQGLPMVTVEMTVDGQPGLEAGVDAEILVTKKSSEVLWHKERLLNAALEALPPECEYVCWIDADVVFERNDWVAASIAALQDNVVIQPFANVIKLPQGRTPAEFPSTRIGLLGGGRSRIRRGKQNGQYTPSFASRLKSPIRRYSGTTGFAWCAQRGVLDRHGFYDRCIVGGGDREIALACVLPTAKVPDKLWRIHNAGLRADIAPWHDAFFADVNGRLGGIDGAIHHLWHGDPANRSYEVRHEILEKYAFDPQADLVSDENGCWKWAPGREALADAIKGYLTSRKEDG